MIPEDEAAETWDEFWKADRDQAVLAQVDGDYFLAFYVSIPDGEIDMGRISAEEITEIVTDPDDSSVPLFYKRQWTTPGGEQKTMYYPDWEALFRGDLERAELPRDAVRADKQSGGFMTVCLLHI